MFDSRFVGRLSKAVRRLVTFGVWLTAPAVAQAQATAIDSVLVVGVSPGSHTVVIVEAANVSLDVTAHAAREVVASLVEGAGPSSRHSYSGLLRASLDRDTVRIALARQLDAPRALRVVVPAGVTLRLAGDNGGDVRVEGVGGPVEITNSNGGVSVLDASGYALVATSNGNVGVRLATVMPDAPMSFITSNGNIDLTLPADVRATLVIDVSVILRSDFPATRAEDDEARRSPRLVRLLINGGGPTIRVFTNNGIVRLHRLAPSSH